MELEETKQRLQQRVEENRRLDMDKDFLERNLVDANHALNKLMNAQKDLESEASGVKGKLDKEKGNLK